MSEGIPGTRSGELKGTSSNNKLKVSFYFPLSPSPTESLPFPLIMDILGQPLFILKFQVYKKLKRILRKLKEIKGDCKHSSHEARTAS